MSHLLKSLGLNSPREQKATLQYALSGLAEWKKGDAILCFVPITLIQFTSTCSASSNSSDEAKALLNTQQLSVGDIAAGYPYQMRGRTVS